MKRSGVWAVWAMVAAVGFSRPADAIDLWPFDGDDDRVLRQLQDARARGELDLASALLQELEALRSSADVDVGLETARLVAARGELEEAMRVYNAVAELEPHSPAREELAAIQTQLGRWPEAVVSLERAFEERSAELPAERVRADPRFAQLVGFEPFDQLVSRVREAQAGPMGRMLIRLERLETTARDTMTALERLSDILTLTARVATSFFLPLVAFVLLGLLGSAGAAQLGSIGRPWTLLTGFVIASAVWVSGARSLTGGSASGWETVLLGSAIVLGAWGLLALLAWGLRELRDRYRPDPWGAKARSETIASLKALLDAAEQERAAPDQLYALSENVRRRLAGQSNVAKPDDGESREGPPSRTPQSDTDPPGTHGAGQSDPSASAAEAGSDASQPTAAR